MIMHSPEDGDRSSLRNTARVLVCVSGQDRVRIISHISCNSLSVKNLKQKWKT